MLETPGPQSGAPPANDVCVIIPMFNEAAVIADVVAGLLKEFPIVVCVDDGSSDAVSYTHLTLPTILRV